MCILVTFKSTDYIPLSYFWGVTGSSQIHIIHEDGNSYCPKPKIGKDSRRSKPP